MTSLFLLHNFCEFLDSPSKGFRGQRPPAGQDFEKWHFCFDLDGFCEFLVSQSVGLRGRGDLGGRRFVK